MSATAWKSPSTIVNDSSVGTVSWTNIANLGADDAAYAQPFNGDNMSANVISDIKLVVANNIVGTKKSDTNNAIGYNINPDWRYIPRSVLETFGQTLTSTQVNAATFGVALAYGKKDFGTQVTTTRSYYAKMSGFNFDVPSGATITGFEIRVKGEYKAYAGPGIEYVYVGAIQMRAIYTPAIVPDQPTLSLKPVRGDSYFEWGLTPFTYQNGYKFRKKITIKKSQVSGSSDLSNFEFGYHNIDTDLRSKSNGGSVEYNYGSLLDIRFELPNGTKLAHEIERYESNTGKIDAWIKIPTLYKNVDTEIYVYYGKKLEPTTLDGILLGYGYRSNTQFTGRANWMNAIYNNGELELFGSNIVNPFGVNMIAPTAVAGNGPTVTLSENNEGATGIITGYLMYSQQNVQARFGVGVNYNQNYVGIRRVGNQWQVDNNGAIANFTPVSTDVIVAYMEWNAAGTTNSFRIFAPIRAGEESDARSVWNPNYRSILHFNQIPDALGTTQEYYDSSTRGNTGSSNGSMNSADLVDTKLGKGVDLDGSNDYIRLNVDQANHTLNVNGDMTLSIWFQPYNFTSRYDLIGKAFGGEFEITAEPGGYLNHYWGTTGANSGSPNVNPGYQSVSSNGKGVLATYAWHQVVISRKLGAGGWLRMYVDGVLVDSASPLYAAATQNALNIELGFGRLGTYFPGMLDEFRLLAEAKTGEQIITEYNNQKATFEYNPEQTETDSWIVGSPEFVGTQFLSVSASGDSNATASIRQPIPFSASASGDADASAYIQFPYLKATVSGDSDASIGEISINPFDVLPISGDSDATIDFAHSIIGSANVAGSATAIANFDQYSPDIDKKYYYDVFTRGGQYVGSWTNEVTTPFKLPEQINTAGSAMTIELGRNPRNFGENVDVAFGNRVVIRVVDNEMPNGKNVFQGRIVDYQPNYNNKNVAVVLESYGSQFEAMLVETGESDAFSYTPTLANTTLVYNGTGLYHAILTPNTATKISAIEYMMSAPAANKVGSVARVDIYETGNYDTPISTATAAMRSVSPEVYKFQFQNTPVLAQSTNYEMWFSVDTVGHEFRVHLDANAGDTDADMVGLFGGKFDSQWQQLDYDAWFKLYKTTGSTRASYPANTELSDALRDILTNYNERGGVITFDVDSIQNTGVTAAIVLNSISILDAINEILKHAPAGFYWYIDQGERKFYFKHYATEAEHTFMVGHHVTALQNAKSIAQIKNVVYFTGKGIYKKYTRQSSIDKYDESAKPFTDGRVELEASADLVANRYLDIYSAPRFDVAFTVADNNVDPRGYDLESVVIGQMVRLGNLNPPSSTQYDIAQYDDASYDYALEDASSLTFQLTNVTREKGILSFTLSNYPTDEDTNRTIQQLKNALNGIRTEDNPATPDV